MNLRLINWLDSLIDIRKFTIFKEFKFKSGDDCMGETQKVD